MFSAKNWVKLSWATPACNNIDPNILSTDYDEVCTFQYRIAFVYLNIYNLTIAIGIDDIFHLHSLKHQEFLSAFHHIANLAINRQNNTRQRRFNSTSHTRCSRT